MGKGGGKGKGREGKGRDGKRREGREEREGRSLPKSSIPPQLLLNYNGHSVLDNPILYVSHYTQIIQSMCTFIYHDIKYLMKYSSINQYR
jgi:hypothetical protein